MPESALSFASVCSVLGYLFLAVAIATEVVATTFLKFTSGDNPKWWAFVIVVVGYVASFFALSLALGRGVPLGIAYAIWSAVGVAAIAIISWVFFKESLTWVQIAGLVLVIGGVGLLELGAKHPA
ncbi:MULTISPECIES: DMT family transporter [Leifsonia]|uniref:DMT family transporter n=1 Tax=Leifsonia TaxID=110932 RepID=UPI000892820E|nr:MULTISPECIES: multidrug efflux SMR transporter [Leifsonia]SEA98971.1 small multidrug resistance pump [Leifsonia sp. 21MFCrub1.1]